MRIASDFAMYYSNTYIGYQEVPGGPILPFYIDNVEWGGEGPPWEGSDDFDGDDYQARDDWFSSDEYNDYTRYAYDNLVFMGSLVINQQGTTRHLEVTGFHNPHLEFRNPLLGFVQTHTSSTNKTWITYLVNRSVKKGLANNRISVSLSSQIAWQAYEKFESDRTERDYHLEVSTGFIKYRHNVVIATKDQDVNIIYLDPLASHLQADLQGLFPTCQITIEEL
jgi:hypothetical protein